MAKESADQQWQDRMPFYEQGTWPEPRDTQTIDYFESLADVWGNDWGAQGIGKLRHALLPTITDDMFDDPAFREDPTWFLFENGIPDTTKMQKEVDELAATLEGEGIEVDFVRPDDWPERYEEGKGYQGAYGTLTTMWAAGEAWVVNGGAINCRSAMAPWRVGMEAWLQKALVRLGVPVLQTVGHTGTGCLEIGNVVLDEKHILLPVGAAGNMEGIKQIVPTLERAGYREVIPIRVPGWHGEKDRNEAWHNLHVSCIFGIVDHGVAIYDPASFPYNVATYLQNEKGMELIEIPRDECLTHACNTVLLEPGKVLIPDGNSETVRLLESHDIEPVVVTMDEFKVAGGTVHCSVGRLRRDDGPLLSDLPDGPDPADVERGPTLVDSL